ncbi:winged helix DNA-binding domain-containing protein [Rhodococcus sp. BP-252]|uniref:winged helix DNA-binding domain-containing protein n=1 Tax=unclassified Rhodococcus (in: high G+C Gram-positive bacteria) TaxID=192944 RepID=UPI001C9A9142|nr:MULTISPECIES: winged helix DNA-binding domain-containing protein [unclassified Rhodococcus (in: high G+C Gram-positive bacteria)]MBY6411702.1 winged helix DNA-binding domain-containing protein [Rhodococcus sp. BP-320]MBY6417313.1 winged helix DNA-binding domain-containing protein [Rhodococcus sp. BP-321]MBY6421902.1 winged helix DNA-binding domain-containing protein [Rhodococcus sp. BP-324]MBY6427337.1 winged helix DNA-binding domain-containing protein [Rhodococcus sp. BP-323]MBY6432520.1 w
MKITDAQRRARLVARQFADSGSPEDVVSSLFALHATDPASVYLSVLARARSLTVEDVRAAMYDRRSLVRIMAMRRTLFVVAHDDVPTVHAAASVGVAKTMRARLIKEVSTLPTEPVLDDVAAWLAQTEEETMTHLRSVGSATGAELSSAVTLLKTAILPTTDKVYDVKRYVTSQVLTMMAAEGKMVRVEPRGAWTSRRHAWAPIDEWWPGGIPDVDEAQARRDLAHRWLEVFGPATMDDVQWWTGWNKTQTRAALAGLDTVDVALEAGDGIMLSDTAFDENASGIMLLPALDPTPMGWKHRDWYLGEYKKPLFDTFGNIGPTIWSDGRIVGGWAVTPAGEVVTELFEDNDSRVIDAEAGRITDLLDGAAVVPSFPTPLEKRLRGK